MDFIPQDALDQHREYLNQSKTSGINPLMFYIQSHSWGQTFASDLPEVPTKIAELLRKLNNAKNLEESLNILNEFSFFPGYPFLIQKKLNDYLFYARDYLEQARQTILPRVPIFAYNKTGSAYIGTVLCRLFETHPIVISFNHLQGVRAWVDSFKQFGGVLHDHYYPSPANLQLLYQAGIHECVIHDRNPVTQIVSIAHHWLKYNPNISAEDKADRTKQIQYIRGYLDEQLVALLNHHGKWLERWQQEEKAGNMRIHYTFYEDMKADKFSFFDNLLNLLQVPYDARKLYEIIKDIENEKTENNKFNYRGGSEQEWREILTEAQQREVLAWVN